MTAPQNRDYLIVRRILHKYGYPPDLPDEAVKAVLMQAEATYA